MSKNLVVISKPLPLEDRDPLWIELKRLASVHVRTGQSALLKEPKVKKAVAVVPLVRDSIDRNFLEKAGHLRVISNFGVGFDNIDVSEATKRGIAVCNTPDVLTNATAEMTIGLLIAAARRFKEGSEILRAGKFKGIEPLFLLGRELAGARLGIIGFGRIGQAVAKKATALGMHVLIDNRSRKPGLPYQQLPLEELVRASDFVSIHCALNAQTRGLFNEGLFKKMKKGSYLVNTARGEIVDERALQKALESKQIAGAALDVFCNEPQLNPKLARNSNLFVLPHLGSATLEARRKMAQLAVSAVIDVLSGRQPVNRVN